MGVGVPFAGILRYAGHDFHELGHVQATFLIGNASTPRRARTPRPRGADRHIAQPGGYTRAATKYDEPRFEVAHRQEGACLLANTKEQAFTKKLKFLLRHGIRNFYEI